MKDTCAVSGFNILRIVNEPTAAAIAYKVPERGDRETILLGLDLGGGTLDFAVLTQEDGIFEVLSNSSDRHVRVGGQDFSSRFLGHLLSTFEAKHPREFVKGEVQKDAGAISALRKAVEVAKRALSTEMSTQVETERFHGGEDLREVVTRLEFEGLNGDLLERMTTLIKSVLEGANLKMEDIDEVLAHHCLSIPDPDVSLLYQILLVGGSAYIPKVRQMVQDYFGKEPFQRAINPDEAVIHGAAI
jgi:endoplasmic reticulum chaperone BiP